MAEDLHLYIEDFCCIAKASIPLHNRGLVLVTGDNQDTNAADNNGAGKSTLFKAVTWCLFGETLDGDRYDEVIRWGQKRAEVGMSFNSGKTMWVVRRWRTKGAPGLSLAYVDVSKRGHSKDIEEKDWEGSAKEIQAKIIELYGYDFRGFCNTKLFGQGDNNRFFSSTDSVRKDTLHKVLRTDQYRRAEKRLREREAKALRVEVQQLEADLAKVRARKEEYDVEGIRVNSEAWEERQDARIEEELATARDKLAKVKAVDAETQRTRKTLEAALKEAEAGQREIEKMEKEVQEADDQAKAAEEKVRDLQARVREIDLGIGELDRKLDQLTQETCPVCTSPLTKGVPATYRKKLSAEKERLTAQVDPMREQIRNAVSEQAKWEKEVSALERALNEAGEAVDNPATIQAELNRLDEEAARKAASDKEAAQRALAKAREMQEEENPYEGSLTKAQERLAELEREEREQAQKLEEKRYDQAHYEFWVRGFGPQGLPSLSLDEVMPYLTERTNYYLETLTDGDITVGISTQKELKKGEKKDEIEIEVTIEGVPGAKPSQGQKRKLETATELALMDLAKTREGSSGSFMMIDELLDGVDRAGRSRVLQLLQELRGKVGSIFVVTQEPQLAEIFERVILVTKSAQRAEVTEVE